MALLDKSIVDFKKELHLPLIEALSLIKPLVNQIESNIRLKIDWRIESSDINEKDVLNKLNRLASKLDIDKPFHLVDTNSGKLNSFELAINFHLNKDVDWTSFYKAKELSDEEINSCLDFIDLKGLRKESIEAENDIPINIYSKGSIGKKLIVIVIPCGMPASIAQKWIDELSDHYFVATWESRFLFGKTRDRLNSEDLYTVDAQVRDLIAVIDFYGYDSAHIMGLCGGAVIALKAASLYPKRISSLSLWHGDYDFNGQCAKTKHQDDVANLMQIVGTSPKQSKSLQILFSRPRALDAIPLPLAHQVMYPYANEYLLNIYGKLNGAIMSFDISNTLKKVNHRSLIVTSKNDTTAHPEGSYMVAKTLSNAKLHIEKNSKHLDLFNAGSTYVKLAKQFISLDN